MRLSYQEALHEIADVLRKFPLKKGQDALIARIGAALVNPRGRAAEIARLKSEEQENPAAGLLASVLERAYEPRFEETLDALVKIVGVDRARVVLGSRGVDEETIEKLLAGASSTLN